MKRSNRLIILVGILLAIVAFVAIVAFLNQQAETAPDEEEEVLVPVLIATQDIAIGDEVTADMVEVDEVRPEAVDGTAIADPSQLRDRTALFAVPEGAQVNQEVFGVVGQVSIDIEGQLRPGEKAVAFQVDRATGLDFIVQQGDVIDIIIGQQIQVLQPTADSAQTPDQPPRFETVTGLESARTVKTVLQAKRVLYVSATRVQPAPDPEADPDEQEAEPGPAEIDTVIIVFAGTNQDAELIKFAQRDQGEIGALTVTLRGTDDDAIEETTGMTIDILFETYGVPIPSIIELEEDTP